MKINAPAIERTVNLKGASLKKLIPLSAIAAHAKFKQYDWLRILNVDKD
jgi:hypothetical protein